MKINIIGTDISVTSYEDVAAAVAAWLSNSTRNHRARYICATSVHGVITARHDAGFKTILNSADIVTPDGMPLVWALRSFGAAGQQRVYGPTLMLHLCAAAERFSHRVFLYGGRREVLPLLREELVRRYPKLLVVGSYSPPFRPLTMDEDEQVKEMIRGSRANLIFVGISTPKQEAWMAAHREDFPGTVMVGVGAAFDFHAKRVRQAPAWMQRRGLEWLFRLLMEPARLWKRYLLITPQFLPLWSLQKLGLMGPRGKTQKSRFLAGKVRSG